MSDAQALRSHSRFIPLEEIDDSQVIPWRFGAVDRPGTAQPEPAPAFIPAGSPTFNGFFSPSLGHEPQPGQPAEQEPAAPALDEAQLQQMLDEARAQGHAQGLEQGRAEGRSQTQQQWQQRMDDYVQGAGREAAQQVSQVVESLDAGLKQVQASMAQELLGLACDIARQVVRQELRSQPQALLPVIREAVDMLIEESRPVTVRLSPADFEALEPALRTEYGAHGRLQWQADVALSQGDVKVESGGAEVDGGLDKRWRRAVAALGLVSTWYDEGKA